MAGAEVTQNGNGRVQGKRVLVVGGAGSIGAAIVERMLQEGARVVAADRNPASLAAFEASAGHPSLSSAIIDISDPASVKSGVAKTLADLGGLDVVVNATGISHQGTTLEEETVEGWNQVLAVNLTGSFVLAKETLDHLSEGASYVFISSGGAEHGLPLNLAYGASKAGLANFTKGLSLAVADRGVRVNTVGPGLMAYPVRNDADQKERREGRTDVVPLGRLGEGADIAGMVAFLASDEASWVTGQNIYVDGGSMAR
ncbi:SDR family NAD(P)-dependent oxidoreductase [Microbacterium sp. Root61]|uniref:SDR family NAD(P)-dependent oxidoreductase n=1 Tax=Microbacterium sp. Root61 TaxID=1736570 RepID=UPI00138F7182|nr:SDR family oxidoreductase [Microbacterium sp. Root61]